MVLLALAGAVLVAALVLRAPWALLSAAVLAYAAGLAAARLVADELAQSRHDAARDRVRQAHAYAAITRTRVREHADSVAELRTRLHLAEECAADTSVLLVDATRRTARLQTTVDTLRAELAAQDDLLATWDGSTEDTDDGTDDEHASVVDLLAWEQRANAAADLPRRKHA